MKGYIYKLMNTVNGKGYVGLTTFTPEQRLQGHLSSSDKGSAFVIHRAIRKYGIDSFSLSVLEEVESEKKPELKKLLAEREIFHIAKENCHVSNHGYNMTIGGEGVVGKPYTEKQKEMRSKQFRELWKQEDYSSKVLKGVTEYWDSDRSLDFRKAVSKESSSRKRTPEQLEAMRKGYEASRKNDPEKWNRIYKKVSEANSHPLSESHKQNISESTKGIPKSEEMKSRLKATNESRYKSDENYKQQINTMVKNAHTPEANKKRSESKKKFDRDHPDRFVGSKNPNSKRIIYLPENLIFDTRKDAAKHAGCHPTTIRRMIIDPSRNDWDYFKGENNVNLNQ